LHTSPTSTPFGHTAESKEQSEERREMLEEPDISSLIDALNDNRVLLARTRICLTRLQKNPRRYNGRIEANAPRKIAYMINLTPSLARRVLEDPRLQEDGTIVGVMKKSERLRMVQNPSLLPLDVIANSASRMSMSKAMFFCQMLMLLV
jgi:hypothetical protein